MSVRPIHALRPLMLRFVAALGACSSLPALGARCAALALVLGLLAPTPARATGTLPNGKVGVAYSVDVDGNQPDSGNYSITDVYSGSTQTNLPGLTMDPATGTIHGTPTGTGTYHFYFKLYTSDGEDWFDDRFITIDAPTITLSPGTLPDATLGAGYSQQFVASGGMGPHNYALGSGSILPAGMTFSAGTLAGTPSQAGNFVFSVLVTDSATGPGGPFSKSFNYTLVVDKHVQTIAFGAQPTRTFEPGGQFVLDPAATASSGLAVSYSSQTGQVCTINGITVTMLAASSCTIAADQAGNDSYAAAPTVAQSIAIGVATQTITGFTAHPAAPTFTPNGTFTVSATGGASSSPVVFASTSASVCTVSGNTVTMLAAGTCSLTANQAGDGNYSAAPQVTLDVAIGAATQAIAHFAAHPAAPTFTPNGTFTVSATGGASSSPVVFASTSASVCTVSGNTVTMLAAGTCSLTANQAGDGNYSAAPQVTLDVAIGAATQAIAHFAANPAAPTFTPNGTFTVSATGGASSSPVVFASTSASVCTVSGSAVTMLAAGTCALTADQAGDANYSAAPQVALKVAIGRATPNLDWIGDLRKSFGESAFELPDPASDSDGAFSFSSSDTAVATVNGRTVTLAGAGSTTLTATQAATANYAAASVSFTLAIDDRPDPTRDPTVSDGLQAQVDASVRFAAAQQASIGDRLRQVRSSGANPSHNGVALNVAGGPALMLSGGQVAGDKPERMHGWGVWSAGSITTGERDARSPGGGFEFSSDGVTVGADRLFGNALFGVAAGLGWNDTDLDPAGSQLDASQRSLAAYGLWRAGEHWYVDGLLGFGRLQFDIGRWSAVAGALANAQRDGDQWFGSLSAGYQHQAESMMLAGYGRLDASRTTLDAYRESGLGLYDLAYREQRIDGSSVALGVEGSYLIRSGSRSWRPFWLAEYRNALEDSTTAGINYVVQPRDTDYVLGLRSFDRNVWAFGGGVDLDFDSGWALSLVFRREQSDHVDSNSIGFRVSYGAPSMASASPEWLDGAGGPAATAP